MNPLSLSRSLSRDTDKRRLWWLLRLPTLQHDHRAALSPIRHKLTEADRALIRTLFSLYRPRGVPRSLNTVFRKL